MKRYSILVREHGDEYELCQVDDNPQAVVAAAEAKKDFVASRSGTRRIGVKKYASVRFVENKRRAS